MDPDGTDRTTYDTDEWVGMVGVSWSPGAERRHREQLDATRRLEIATVTGKVQPIVVSHDDSTKDGNELSLKAIGLSEPESIEEAWTGLIWTATIGAAVAVLGLANWLGIPVPGMSRLRRRSERPEDKETT